MNVVRQKMSFSGLPVASIRESYFQVPYYAYSVGNNSGENI